MPSYSAVYSHAMDSPPAVRPSTVSLYPFLDGSYFRTCVFRALPLNDDRPISASHEPITASKYRFAAPRSTAIVASTLSSVPHCVESAKGLSAEYHCDIARATTA